MGVQPITIPQSLAYVLNNAGDKSNVDFSYLVETAQRESSMNPSAKAPSSSAVGLFQFLDSTWLQVMKQEGPRLGYQEYADAITTDRDGDYIIKDKKLRAEVLKLREDPQVAADMAAAFTRTNGAYLEKKFGRMPSPGELYIAHFLGPQGAEKMFNAGLADPDQVAAKLFPKQAKANPQIFYANGHPRTVREVYKALVAQHGGIVAEPVVDVPDAKFAAQQLATDLIGKLPVDAAPVSRFSKADMSFMAMFSTETPSGVPQPLIGAEAAAPLIAAQGVQPLALAATDAAPEAAPLIAIDVALLPAKAVAVIGDPFPAPAPLIAPPMESPSSSKKELLGVVAAGPLIAPQAEQVPLALMPDEQTEAALPSTPDSTTGSEIPRPRVLMSPGEHHPNSAFFTQLHGSGTY
jgi:hypothetical protein